MQFRCWYLCSRILRGGVGVGQQLNTFLQFTHICTSTSCGSIYAYALPYDS